MSTRAAAMALYSAGHAVGSLRERPFRSHTRPRTPSQQAALRKAQAARRQGRTPQRSHAARPPQSQHGPARTKSKSKTKSRSREREDEGGGGHYNDDDGGGGGHEEGGTDPPPHAKKKHGRKSGKSHTPQQGKHGNQGIRHAHNAISESERQSNNLQKFITSSANKSVAELLDMRKTLQSRVGSGRCSQDQFDGCTAKIRALNDLIADT
jgi:hypothetical protein